MKAVLVIPQMAAVVAVVQVLPDRMELLLVEVLGAQVEMELHRMTHGFLLHLKALMNLVQDT